MDCAKAASLVETTICADAQLKWQDDAISRNYFAALKSSRTIGDKASHDLMQAEQRRWLSRREACGLLASRGTDRLRREGDASPAFGIADGV